MAKIIKYDYEIQAYYGKQYGYECVTTEENFRDAAARLKEYRENEPGYSFRIKKIKGAQGE